MTFDEGRSWRRLGKSGRLRVQGGRRAVRQRVDFKGVAVREDVSKACRRRPVDIDVDVDRREDVGDSDAWWQRGVTLLRYLPGTAQQKPSLMKMPRWRCSAAVC